MYGSARLNVQKQSVSENVKFELKHALACLADTVTVKMSDGLYQKMCSDTLSISITGLKIVYSNLTTKARLVLNSTDEPIWKEVISGELLTSRKYEKVFSQEEEYEFVWDNTDTEVKIVPPDSLNIDEGHGLFYIPLQIAGQDKPQVEVTLSYRVTGVNDNGNFDDTMIASKEFTPGHPGMKQRLVLTLQDNFNLEADIVAEGISMPADILAEEVDFVKTDTLKFYGDNPASSNVQLFTVPRTGIYKLEAWGAQGGRGAYDPSHSINAPGAVGGYATAEFELSIGDVLYVYVGGKGEDSGKPYRGVGGWNGGGNGGNGYNSEWSGGGGGGGATHIAMADIGAISAMSFQLSVYEGTVGHLLLVAAGGGGGSSSGLGCEPGAGGGGEGNRGGQLPQWNYESYSHGANGITGYEDGNRQQGNGGGGGGYIGGSANSSELIISTGGSGGSSKANIARYNFVLNSFSTISGNEDTYPDPKQSGNGLVVITFVKSL